MDKKNNNQKTKESNKVLIDKNNLKEIKYRRKSKSII